MAQDSTERRSSARPRPNTPTPNEEATSMVETMSIKVSRSLQQHQIMVTLIAH